MRPNATANLDSAFSDFKLVLQLHSSSSVCKIFYKISLSTNGTRELNIMINQDGKPEGTVITLQADRSFKTIFLNF
jgi:hypothetical protein